MLHLFLGLRVVRYGVVLRDVNMLGVGDRVGRITSVENWILGADFETAVFGSVERERERERFVLVLDLLP